MNTSVRAGGPTFHPVEPESSFAVPVRHREFLAGSGSEHFPEAVPDAGGFIPIQALHGAEGMHSALAAAVRETIDSTLPDAGGVLLRGLPLADRADFEQIVAALAFERAGYEGGIAVRSQDAGIALAASQEDRRITLSPHNEMAYLPRYPRRIFFFCESQATSGGEVPVNDIRETAVIIPAEVKDAFRKRGIRYHRNLPRESTRGEMGWVDTFRTDDRAVVEEHMATAGYTFQWRDDGGLYYHYRHDAFTSHPETGEELWFNQVTELHCSYWRAHPEFPADLPDHAYPATTTYGDGAVIDEELISALRGALWTTTRALRMRRGDLLVLDNQVMQHGRFAFEGPRRHFVSLAQ